MMGTPSTACNKPRDLAWTGVVVPGEWFPGNTLDNFFSIQVCADENDRKWVFNVTSVGFAYGTGFCEQNLEGKIDVGDGTGSNVDSDNYCEILRWLGNIDPDAHQPYQSKYYSRNVLQLHESIHLDRVVYTFRTKFFDDFRDMLGPLSEPISDCSEPASSVLERKRTALEWHFDKVMKSFVKSLEDDEEKVAEATEIYFKGLANTIRTRATNASWRPCK